MESNRDVLLRVTNGNPGAVTVVNRLQYFSKWWSMIKFLDKTGLIGSDLWAFYKDVHGSSILETGKAIEEQMEEVKFQEKLSERPLGPSKRDIHFW